MGGEIGDNFCVKEISSLTEKSISQSRLFPKRALLCCPNCHICRAVNVNTVEEEL